MADGRRPLVSICIVTGRRIPLLDACLACLQEQEGAPDFEVLVCSDGDDEVRAAVHARFPDARVCHVSRALPGAARNLLVEAARGDVVFFLDDDVTFGPGLLARLAELVEAHPEVGVFGGPNDTPPGSSSFQEVQGAVLASMVGSGPVRRRYGRHPAGPADERFFILCNLAVRREVMVPFALDLICAEENGVLAEMSRAGVRMHYDPELVVYHERRPTRRGFAQQMHKYGRGRGQLLVREPRTLRPSYVAPSGLVAYGLASPALALVVGPAALAPLAVYLAAVVVSGLWIARTLRRPASVVAAVACTLVLHLCYGLGVVRGLATRRPRVEPEVLSWAGPVTVGDDAVEPSLRPADAT